MDPKKGSFPAREVARILSPKALSSNPWRGPDPLSGYARAYLVRSADSPPEIDTWINTACLLTRIPFIVSGTSEQKGLLGPLVIPYETACVDCSETVPRRRRHMVYMAGMISDLVIASTLIIGLWLNDSGYLSLHPYVYAFFKAAIRVQFLTLVWQFLFYMRTDIYYFIANLLGLPQPLPGHLDHPAQRAGS